MPVRDLIAVFTVVLALGCVILAALLGGVDFQRSGELVETQPRQSATLVEVVDAGRGDNAYYVQLGDNEVEADYGSFITDPTPGTTVEVVRDPENPSHVIAVGTPQDWADRPWLIAVTAVVALAVAFLSAFVAGLRVVPERAEPALEKLFKARDRLALRVDRKLRGWFGGGSPSSGRHS